VRVPAIGPHRRLLDGNAAGSRVAAQPLNGVDRIPAGRIRQHADARQARNELLQELEPLAFDLCVEGGQSGDVAARAGETAHCSDANGVPYRRHHNRDCRRRTLRSEGGRRTPGQDQIGVAFYKAGCECRIALLLALGEALLKANVLALAIAQITKALAECLQRRKTARHQNANPLHLTRLRRSKRRSHC
jgi:hypothetical protein